MIISDQFPSFFTATILNWNKLLAEDKFKMTIVESLQYLVNESRIKLYAYVLMPNHVHFVWEQFDKPEIKETAKGSFMKFTGHTFKKMLRGQPAELAKYLSGSIDRNYNFWQRDALPISLYSREISEQKIEYIHNNPLQEHWNLCKEPEDYRFSSARFYKHGHDEFNMLTHYIEVYG